MSSGKPTWEEMRYQLDRVFTRMREEILFYPLVDANFPAAQTALQSISQKYHMCIELRDQHEKLKQDPYFSFEEEFKVSLERMIIEHNKTAKSFQVDPL